MSSYQHSELDLAWADRDAREFYELIRTPSGGGFKEENIQLLLNEQATERALRRALRRFLVRPDRDDLVLLYLACHGAVDPERPANVYLLPHDVDPDDIASTALPMREIDHALREILHAEKVVIIADTCHSAAIGGGSGQRRAVTSTSAVNTYLRSLSEAKGGVALLTSAEANEVSLEGEQWGGGHGVFTHYVLEGMRGAADSHPRNGVVTVGELFEYVRDNVKADTDHRQHPTIGQGPFDRSLPMAMPGLETAARLKAEAKTLQEAGSLDQAFERWTEVLRLVPRDPEATHGLELVERARAEKERKAKAREAKRKRAVEKMHRTLLALYREREL
ncbi:MAG TPA: caspase family protein, partial [Longimicrobiales bacterium]|nr:caspase family protein [Longimicrobiales bacterium]